MVQLHVNKRGVNAFAFNLDSSLYNNVQLYLCHKEYVSDWSGPYPISAEVLTYAMA